MFIPCSFTYFATVGNEGNRKVILKATVMKFTKIDMVFQLKEKGKSCAIDEEITIQSKLPIKSMLGKILKKQHQQIFKNIENLN